MCLRSCFLLIVISGLAACNIQNLQPAKDVSNIIEVEKRAHEAYQKED